MAQSDITPGNDNLYIITYTDETKNIFRSSTLARSNAPGKAPSSISLDVASSVINTYNLQRDFNTEMESLGQATLSYDPFVLLPPNCTAVDDNGDCTN